ncbi:MAG: hypothetical protein GXP45_07495, partial [bacterium]|nr:hypothetical protein [bacterium]
SLFANKLYTVYQREERSHRVASRDLYDVWFFFKNHWPINQKLLEERSSMSVDDFLLFLRSFIEKHYNKNNLLL